MKLVVQLKLKPDAAQASALAATLHACNEQANLVSEVAFTEKAFRNYALRKLVYAEVRAAGRKLNRYRRRQFRLRAKLQKKGTKSAKRVLKRQSRKESRRAKDINHCISKQIVTEAERTGRCIALEDLGGIRERVRLRKPQRVALHSWAFAQLGEFIAYKAKKAGVPVVFVDPSYTSQMCCECQYVDKKNRVDQALFICRGCGVVAHADRNASHNIAHRGETVWNAGRKSHVPATQVPACLSGQDAEANPTATRALSASSVLQGREADPYICRKEYMPPTVARPHLPVTAISARLDATRV